MPPRPQSVVLPKKDAIASFRMFIHVVVPPSRSCTAELYQRGKIFGYSSFISSPPRITLTPNPYPVCRTPPPVGTLHRLRSRPSRGRMAPTSTPVRWHPPPRMPRGTLHEIPGGGRCKLLLAPASPLLVAGGCRHGDRAGVMGAARPNAAPWFGAMGEPGISERAVRTLNPSNAPIWTTRGGPRA